MKNLKEEKPQTFLPVTWEMGMQVKMQELEQDVEQLMSLNLGKARDKTAHYHSAYVKYTQTILFKMPGWMNNKLASRFLE